MIEILVRASDPNDPLKCDKVHLIENSNDGIDSNIDDFIELFGRVLVGFGFSPDMVKKELKLVEENNDKGENYEMSDE